MKLKKARPDDLPELKRMYAEIIREMEAQGLFIWDEIYPCSLFQEDIERGQLYLLMEEAEIAAAFALSDADAGGASPQWREADARTLYLSRLGVRAGRQGRGVGGRALEAAAEAARRSGAAYLRLFVVEGNAPAIAFYLKNGFTRAEGIREEDIGEAVLREYGFERQLI